MCAGPMVLCAELLINALVLFFLPTGDEYGAFYLGAIINSARERGRSAYRNNANATELKTANEL